MQHPFPAGAFTRYDPQHSASVQLYSVRDAFTAGPAATSERLAAIGFRQVEPYDFVSHADALDTALLAAGLTAPSGHAPLLSTDHTEVFDAAERLGIGLVIEPFVPARRWQEADDIRRTADALNEAAAAAAAYGHLQVGYHNHDWELAPLADGRTGLDHLVDHLEPEVALEIDAYWVAVGGQDPAALLRRLGDRVRAVHLKDGPLDGGTAQQQPLGHGSIDVAEILGAVPELDLAVVEFDDYSGDIFDAVGRSLAHLEGELVAREQRA